MARWAKTVLSSMEDVTDAVEFQELASISRRAAARRQHQASLLKAQKASNQETIASCTLEAERHRNEAAKHGKKREEVENLLQKALDLEKQVEELKLDNEEIEEEYVAKTSSAEYMREEADICDELTGKRYEMYEHGWLRAWD